MALRFLDHLRDRHARLERDITAERTRIMPDFVRMQTLKKSKLTVKDRMAILGSARQRPPETHA